MKKRILLIVICFLLLLITGCDTEVTHTFASQYSNSNDYHWFACEDENCDETKDKEPHTFENDKCVICGFEKEVEVVPHDHSYQEDYQYDDTAHYKLCEFGGCEEKTSFENHEYSEPTISYEENFIINTYVCSVCGYTKQDKVEISYEIDDSIQWDNVFNNFILTNFEMKVYLSSEDINHCIVTDKVVYYHISGGSQFYTTKNDDSTYTVYEYDYDLEKWIKFDDPDGTYFIGASTETVIRLSFASYFDKFTYDPESNSYISNEPLISDALDWDGTSYGKVVLLNTVVKFENGNLVSIASKYKFVDEEGNEYDTSFIAYFEYYNIGKAEVEVPQEIIDNAVEIENIK